jgi:hypothetical protein
MTEEIEEIDQSELVDANVGARISGLKATTLRKMGYLRLIRTFKVGGALRFKVADLRALIKERPAVLGARGPRGGVSNP